MAAVATTTMIGFLVIFLSSASGQYLDVASSKNSSGICLSVHVNSIRALPRLKGCVVIVGNLRVVLMGGAHVVNVFNVSFPELREVTGFVVVYWINSLESIGQLFPNLARIRGGQLINNYGLVLHDLPDLREVGLYSLLKIDRGGVIVSGTPHNCYANTVDWNAIAPHSRHMLTYPEMTAHCNMAKSCKCGPKGNNFCWNSKKCQRFISNERSSSCHPECLGCNHDPDVCSICRHYTHRGRCVSQCPPETILLPDSQYCITIDDCISLNGGFIWNQTCVFDCPVGYEKLDVNGANTCEECASCRKECGSLIIHSLSGIQQADGCVMVNGSLTLHVSPVPGAVDDLKKYLKYIEIITDYVYIYSSVAITSFDFLPNLKQIAGRKLRNDTYSLIVHDMKNLRELFTPTVMKDLQIDRGKLKILNNPMLCMNKINEMEKKFRIKSNETEIPPELNGYSGDCEDFGLRVEKVNDTAATILFSPNNDTNIQYTVLYAKVPIESYMDFVPETCSKSEWITVHSNDGKLLLTSLHPASTYAVCIESIVYSKIPLQSYIARSPIVHFTMPFVNPEPPFILEIVSTSPNAVYLRWVDHRDYRRHITSYQLYVTLIDIPSKDVSLRDHCNMNLDEYYDSKEEYSRHVVVLKPPAEYKSCETNCLSLIPPRQRMSLIEDHFDVCNSLESDCDKYEEAPPKNSSFKNYVKSIALNITGPAKSFRVEGLAPFRDYKIRLRSCTADKCSRSTRAVIRTLRSNKADIPSITHSSIDENRNIYIKWEAAEETNGPVFMYLVQVLPDAATTNETLADIWCVNPKERSLIVRSQVTQEFQVRVCSSTLGSFSVCTEWQRISIPKVGYNLSLVCIIFSITLTVVSIGIGIFYKRRIKQNDTVPLVDMTSLYRSESEPPVVMMTDFMPLYSVPLNDALLDY